MKTGTVVRTIVLLFALANQFLTWRGLNPLPFSEDEVYVVVSDIITWAAAIWAWWKNNSFTWEAQKADEYLKDLKGRE